jgi:hypothetical protein
LLFNFGRESPVSTLSVTSKKRSVLWRPVFLELTVLFVGLVVYAVLVSINQPASLFVIMIASLTVGNLLIPLQFACRRLYVTRPYPWNWVAFFPVQVMFGVICAVGAVLFLRLTKVDRESFSLLFTRIGYFVIVVAVVTNVVLFGVEELQRKLRERNQQLEQTVEKGTSRCRSRRKNSSGRARFSKCCCPARCLSLPEFRSPEPGSLREKSVATTSRISATTQPYLFYESLERRREPTPRYVRGGSVESFGVSSRCCLT